MTAARITIKITRAPVDAAAAAMTSAAALLPAGTTCTVTFHPPAPTSTTAKPGPKPALDTDPAYDPPAAGTMVLRCTTCGYWAEAGNGSAAANLARHTRARHDRDPSKDERTPARAS